MDGILVSDYTVELTRNFTSEYIDYVCRLCDERSKELKEKNDNYTYERMKFCFDQGRFAYGFYIVKCKDKIVCTAGIDNFEGWAVGTRYLRYNSGTRALFPVRWLLNTIIHDHLNKSVEGFCITQNLDQRNVVGQRLRQQQRIQKAAELYGPDSIFAATIEVNNNAKKLDYSVLYRNTVQEVYTFYTDKIPPFERA